MRLRLLVVVTSAVLLFAPRTVSALGLDSQPGGGVSGSVLMQQNAVYTVISPEGCAAILWKDAGEAKRAAAALRPTAEACLALGVVDVIVPEPSGGAHRDHTRAAELLADAIQIELEVLAAVPPTQRRAGRRAKFRGMGAYQE